MKTIQVLIIHGGTTFKNERDYVRHLRAKKVSLEKKASWAGDYLGNNLGRKFKTFTPRMPLQDWANYRDWKIVFEKYLPLLKDDFILLGGSLGGIFLAKYLSENKLPRTALSVYLVCPPFDDTIPGEDLAGGFRLKTDLSLIETNCKNLHVLFSKDDNVVPISHAEKYRQKLKGAHIVIFNNKNGHFQVSKFPEIIKLIKADAAARAQQRI